MVRFLSKFPRFFASNISQRIHLWYIYLHLPWPWILWDISGVFWSRGSQDTTFRFLRSQMKDLKHCLTDVSLAFQKTASDMEHERINLMYVITQVTPPMLWEHVTNRMMWLTHTHTNQTKWWCPKSHLSSAKLLSKRLEDFFSEIREIGTVWMSYFWGAGEPELRAFVPWDGSTVTSCNQNSTGSGFGRGKVEVKF